MADEKLFVVIVGGYPDGAHVEVHDVRFVVGRDLPDCFDDLKAQWWGPQKRFHIDAWGVLEWADGFDVAISNGVALESPRLWFVNLGGYLSDRFQEMHKNVFVVADTAAEAKTRALNMAPDWSSAHRDVLFDVENTIDVASTLAADFQISLTPAAEEKPFLFEARYLAKLERRA